MRGIETAFIGFVSSEADLRTSRAGKPYCTLSVGVQTGNQTEDGKPIVQWVRTTCFGETAERIAWQDRQEQAAQIRSAGAA